MTIYLDANVLVSATIDDSGSPQVDAFLAANTEALITSDLAWLEFASVMGRLVRTRLLTRSEAGAAFAALDRWTTGALMRTEIQAADIDAANMMLRDFDLGLRGPDGIHVAAVERLSARLATSDKGMARAAKRLGVRVVKI